MINSFIYLTEFNGDTRMVSEFSIDGKPIKALIDTGSGSNYFCKSLNFPENKKDYVNVTSFTGHKKRANAIKNFDTQDEFSLIFKNFYALSLEHLGVNCVIGLPFLVENKIILNIPNYGNSKINGINFISGLEV